MAEILALGLTHFPVLAKPDSAMTSFIPAMLKNPSLPASFRDPANWPAPMRREWGDDEGKSAAVAHRKELLVWMRKCRAALDEFSPDLVLIWGDDQYENFIEDCVPAYCVNAHPDFEYAPPEGNIWDEPEDTRFRIPGHQQAGKHLAGELLRRGFDPAYSYRPLHDPLGHAFTNAILFLDHDRRGFDYPILPFSINSYGRSVICQKGGFPYFSRTLGEDDFDPPAPAPWRLFDLGAETARILAASPLRVALIASSGWSHGFLIPDNHYIIPDVAADRRMYEALTTGDYAAWRAQPGSAMEAAGSTNC